MLANTDNQVMQSITLLTMVFLPATFIAVGLNSYRSGLIRLMPHQTMFSTPFFSFAENGLEMSTDFWVYWVIVVPLTLAVILVWWWWLGGSYEKIKAKYDAAKENLEGRDE